MENTQLKTPKEKINIQCFAEDWTQINTIKDFYNLTRKNGKNWNAALVVHEILEAARNNPDFRSTTLDRIESVMLQSEQVSKEEQEEEYILAETSIQKEQSENS